MPTWLAGGVALAAVVVTYFTCIRPMRRGSAKCCADADSDAVDKQLAQLRQELDALREAGRGELPPSLRKSDA